jgi:nucleoside-diphosphate-sugar epimerase
MSKIFITGASSYLGSSLIKTFKEHSFIGLENKNILPNLPNLKSVKITKFSDFYEILNINNVDTIFHFATNSIRGNDELNKKEIYKVNVELGEVLLNAAIDLNIKKFITAGTYSQNIFKKSQITTLNQNNYFKNYSLVTLDGEQTLRISILGMFTDQMILEIN